MIRVKFEPKGEPGRKWLFGKVEIDGLDISHRVGAVDFSRAADGSGSLTLHIYVHPTDEITLDIPEEYASVEATVIRPNGTVDVTSLDVGFLKRLPAKPVQTNAIAGPTTATPRGVK